MVTRAYYQYRTLSNSNFLSLQVTFSVNQALENVEACSKPRLRREKTLNEFWVVPERFWPQRYTSTDMVDEETEAELREQFTEAFEGADYPVSNPMDLVPALPDGPGTRFEAGDVSFTAMELSTKLSGVQEFPYEDVEPLVNDLLEGLKEKDML